MSSQAAHFDISSYVESLEKNDLLFRISRPVAKETELTSLARLQYRGLPEDKRRGFLFENVTDYHGRKYVPKVATGIYASSTRMYAFALGCEPTREAIQAKWTKAQLNPIEPKIVGSGPVQQQVCLGDDLLKDGYGVESLPIPVEVPGYSGQIRSSTQFVSKDPDTGIRNMGNYSGHIFGKTTIAWSVSKANHGFLHWKAWRSKQKAMPAAIVIGGAPSLFYVGGTKVPYGVDEFTIAGALDGRPIELVKCKTIDLEVPANAEIVIEGLVSPDFYVPCAALGEYNGYMAIEQDLNVFNVTAVTTRSQPIFVHIMSQFPPSESSVIRRISAENVYMKFLKYDCKLPGILDVAWHEMSQSKWCAIKIKKVNRAHPWQVLNCVAGYDAYWGKYFIVVDDDVDIRDFDSVAWALGWRVQPDRDMRVIKARIPSLDHSAAPPDASKDIKSRIDVVGSSSILIDATRKFPYPPTSLPRKEFMEKAVEMWRELNLPSIELKQPWYGYENGNWSEDFRSDAELVLRGEHYKVGDRLLKKMTKVTDE